MTDPTGRRTVELLLLGRVEKPHGLKGAVRVQLFTAGPAGGIPAGTRLQLQDEGAVTVSRCTATGGSRFNLTFLELSCREDAERCRGRKIWIPRDEVMDELDFIPLEIFRGFVLRSSDKEFKVADVLDCQPNPLLILERDEKRFGVPVMMVTDQGRIDWENGIIFLDLPSGLEDLPL